MLLQARARLLRFPRRPLVMGTVRVGTQSAAVDDALREAQTFVELGADAIEVVSHATQTARPSAGAADQSRGLVPFVRRFAETHAGITPVDGEAVFPPLLSVRTERLNVAQEVLAVGGDLLNGSGGLSTADGAAVAARFGAALVVTPASGRRGERLRAAQDIVRVLGDGLEAAIRQATGAGLAHDALVLDPGFDGATPAGEDLLILRELGALHRFERPLLVGVPRWPAAADLADGDAPDTVACVVAAVLRGAAIVRVRHVRPASQTVRVIWQTVADRAPAST